MSARNGCTRVGIDIHTLGRRQTGNETYMRALVGALAAIGDRQVEFFYYATGAVEGLPNGTRRLWPHNRFIRIPLGFPLALWRDGIDVAHFQYVLPPICPCPVVLTVHDISYEQHPEFFSVPQRIRLRALVPQAIRKAAHTVTISEFSRRQILERYGTDPARVTAISLAPHPRFRVLEDREALRAAVSPLALPEGYFLAVGNLQPRKNIERLLRAYSALRASGRSHRALVLVGQKAYQGSQLLRLVQELGLEQHVTFTGYISDDLLVAVYNLAHVFVYPSLYEGFGLPILEAMACGTPVVASRAAAMPEVTGDAALLVDPTSELEIADAMRCITEDGGLHQLLRTRGLERASQFSWEHTATQTLRIYKQCA